jgi:hypothetical protein
MIVRTTCFGADAVGAVPEIRHEIGCHGVIGGGELTSGKVPFEKTLSEDICQID